MSDVYILISNVCNVSLSVLKAQHGCIDCLAWMMCAELDSSKTSCSANSEGSVSTYVVHLLTHKEHEFVPSALGRWSRLSEATVHLPFRLCMANVLISACQKISYSGKKPLAKNILPPVVQSAHVRHFMNFFLVQRLLNEIYHFLLTFGDLHR